MGDSDWQPYLSASVEVPWQPIVDLPLPSSSKLAIGAAPIKRFDTDIIVFILPISLR